MSSETSMRATARVFVAALYSLDHTALAMVSTDTVSWEVPGTGRVSGVHVGVDALIEVATAMRRNAIFMTFERMLTGDGGVTVIVHEVGDARGKCLDVRVGLNLEISDGQVVSAVESVSELSQYDDYWD